MKYIKITVVLILLLICPLTGMGAWQSDGNLKVAMLDIISRVENENIDAVTISDMLQARLVEKKAFRILERTLLNKILEEKKLHMMGLTDADASSVGLMAGADKIITGSISRMAGRYVILVKGIDTRSGVVELADQEMFLDVRDIPNAVQVIADRIVRKARGESIEASSVPSRESVSESVLKSGIYKAVAAGYKSTWKLNISSNTIAGTSSWDCCPGPRIDPMLGTIIDGKTVRIIRDCTGQGIEGACEQVFEGVIFGNSAAGKITMNGRDLGWTWSMTLIK